MTVVGTLIHMMLLLAASESAADTTEEPSEDQVKSPVRSPVKPAKPLFSFATIDSSAKKNQPFSDFTFGKYWQSFNLP